MVRRFLHWVRRQKLSRKIAMGIAAGTAIAGMGILARQPWKTKYVCAFFTRTEAERLFGYKYNPADAWEFAKNNKSAWKLKPGANQNGFIPYLKAGCVVGIYNPESHYLKPGIEYTHVALYMGKNAHGAPILRHKVGEKIYEETLEEFYARHPTWEIREVIYPRN